MAGITLDMRFRLSLIKYAEKFGVAKAAVKYRTNRQYIYRWKRRYDGSWDSLRNLSRRPHSHPNQHTPQEIKLIRDVRRRNPDAGLVVFWVKLMQRGYSRSIPGLCRFLKKQGVMAVHPPNPKHIPKPYEQMQRPGQRIQADVKFVPSACLANSRVIGRRFFQYTAIDEYSRWRFVEAFEEHSAYSSALFIDRLVKAFPCPIECIQTDSLRTALPPTGTNPPFFRNGSGVTASGTSLSVPTPQGITAKWSAATGRTTSVFMPPTVFILLRTLQNSLRHTTAGITTISPCALWDGRLLPRY